LVDTYDMPWRPNFEMTATLGWFGAAASSALLAATAELPAAPFAWIGAIAGIMGATRGWNALKLWRRKRLLLGRDIEFLKLTDLKRLMKSEMIFLGYGFTWDKPETQLCYDLMKRGPTTIAPDVMRLGAPWIHGMSEKEEALWLPIGDTKGHVVIVGTTGSGKTRLFDLLVSQAIIRGDAVNIIDPKGDKELRDNARRSCEVTGRTDRFMWFHPGFPERSARIDPMKNFSRPSDLASRIANLLPGEGPSDPFKSYGQMALNNVIQGLVMTGRQPTLVTIRAYLEGGVDDLVIKFVSVWCSHHVDEWMSEASSYLKSARSNREKAKALTSYYRDKVHAKAPNPDLEGLLSMFEHDPTHFGKMIAALLPLLNQLTSGHMGNLLSPNRLDSTDERPIVDMASIIQRGQTCYIGLDSLTDPIVGSAIGSIILADLAAVAGARYNYGVENRPVSIFIDEAAEIINDPFIQLLNKGRGAELRMILATQTFADLETRLGSKSKALQVLGNVNNTICLRVKDNETQKYITDGLPKVSVNYIMTTQGSTMAADAGMRFSGNVGERFMEEEADLLQPALLGQLPNLEFMAIVSGGKLIKGRLPILKD